MIKGSSFSSSDSDSLDVKEKIEELQAKVVAEEN